MTDSVYLTARKKQIDRAPFSVLLCEAYTLTKFVTVGLQIKVGNATLGYV